MTEFELYLSALAKFLAASLLVERVLELFDQFYVFLGLAAGNKKLLVRLSDKRLPPADEKRRKMIKMFWMQTLGIVAGIIICSYSGLGVAKEFKLTASGALYWWDIVLAGIFISGGSEPIHQLINFLKDHKNNLKTQRQTLEKQQSISEAAVSNEDFPRLGFSYNGGLYPDKPGHGLRKINPRYIVIHHSATDEKAGFNDIVAIEQKERRNRQGSYVLDPSYHCVITYDGMYHNYCRWDSVGWHVARGTRISNSNSLGLCFVGDFHNTSVKPSEAQIETGVRMVTLWRLLYKIDGVRIVPHSKVKARHTPCPGSHFPMERLIARSDQLLKEWQSHEKIQKEINRFKKLDYLYV